MASGTAAHQRYKTQAGLIVPGVTTILNLLAKPALIYWSWNLGMQGQDYRKVTQKAADIGTIAHYMVECHLKGIKPDQAQMDEYAPANIKPAELAYHQFEEWWQKQGWKTVGAEIQLVSEKYLFGGSLDCVAQDTAGKYILIDVKTSKAIYDTMKYQLSAYWNLWEENNPDKPLSNSIIIHLDKLTGNLTPHNMGNDLSTQWELFLHLRAIYSLQKRDDKHRNKDKAIRFRQVQ